MQQIAGCQADVVVLDVSMAGGAQASMRLRASYPDIAIIALVRYALQHSWLEQS